MASLLRFAVKRSCLLLNSTSRCTAISPQVCKIFTSRNTKDAATAAEPMQKPKEITEKLSSDVEDPNWISFGYELDDKEKDTWVHRAIMFAGVTVVICFGGFMLTYQPDNRGNEWCQREGYLELARREKEGLPLIDPNLIDVSKIDLPTDEELQDFEAII